jgi:hypothetical protein
MSHTTQKFQPINCINYVLLSVHIEQCHECSFCEKFVMKSTRHMKSYAKMQFAYLVKNAISTVI